jgi:hypothetical protein
MATRIAGPTRNAQADSAVSGMTTLQLYSGTQPTSADDAATGTLLATITLPGTPFGAASGGTVSKSGTWSGTISTGGTFGWARLSNGSTKRIDMNTTEMVFDSNTFVQGGTVTVSTFTYSVPAS